MGQYYSIVYKNKGIDKVFTNDRKVEGEGREMAKLTEHSYFGNTFMDAVANMLHDIPTRVIWVGDYAEDEELQHLTESEVTYKMVWGDTPKNPTLLKKAKFDYGGKYLVNHDTKQYVSFDDYLKRSKVTLKDWKGMELNPISILTALGNGRGGGDYVGRGMNKVGIWAWNLLEITDEKPKGYRKMPLSFKETWIVDEERRLKAKAKKK